MSVLSNLARVIRTTARGEETELHAYALANAVDIAFSLGVELPAFLDMLDEQILAALPKRLTEEMKEARKGAREEKGATMQRAADIMGHSFRWDGDRAELNLAAFLPAIVAGPELLAFPRFGFGVSLEVLRRFRAQLRNPRVLGWSAYVDAEGLHISWMMQGRSGGLNLRPQRYARHDDVVMCDLPSVQGPVRQRAA